MSRHVGIDLGGTNIKAVVIERCGDELHVLVTDSHPTLSADGPDRVLARVIGAARHAAERYGPPASVGLALPGHFDPKRGTGILVPNLAGEWRGRPIAGPVSAGLGKPVALINDVRALTLAEARMGAGRGFRDILCIALGTGIGGGIVINGQLYFGLGHAGEIGHTTVEPDGPLCGCGNRGCLDRVAGADAIASAAGRATVDEAVAAAETGDAIARAAIERAAIAIGRVLAGAVVLLWPERVVVGGGIAAAGEVLLGPMRQELRRRATVAPVEEIDLVPAELGPFAGAIGAAIFGAGTPPVRSADDIR